MARFSLFCATLETTLQTDELIYQEKKNEMKTFYLRLFSVFLFFYTDQLCNIRKECNTKEHGSRHGLLLTNSKPLLPVRTRRCFNVYTASMTMGLRFMNVKMMLCEYWRVWLWTECRYCKRYCWYT